MAKIVTKTKENPKLLQNTLKDVRISLYLEFYLGYSKTIDEVTGKAKIRHVRKKETLNLYLDLPARTPEQRQKNRETIELAQRIRSEKEQEFKNSVRGYRIGKAKNVNFLDYFQSYIDNYAKKDRAVLKSALGRFRRFLREHYPLFAECIRPQQIGREMAGQFVDFLQSKSKGAGARTIYFHFKRVINYAVEQGLISVNPFMGVRCAADRHTLKKNILSADEIKRLLSTSYSQQNLEVRRAFIFSLYTGLRFCDVRDLRYSNVDFENRFLRFDQNKTRGRSAASWVVIPLSEDLVHLLTGGAVKSNEEHIFALPFYTACCAGVQKWVRTAGIAKHITWHCARHSFAVNILNGGANVKTLASLLGHSGLQSVEKYTRAIDELKEKAINSLPKFEWATTSNT